MSWRFRSILSAARSIRAIGVFLSTARSASTKTWTAVKAWALNWVGSLSCLPLYIDRNASFTLLLNSGLYTWATRSPSQCALQTGRILVVVRQLRELSYKGLI